MRTVVRTAQATTLQVRTLPPRTLHDGLKPDLVGLARVASDMEACPTRGRSRAVAARRASPQSWWGC